MVERLSCWHQMSLPQPCGTGAHLCNAMAMRLRLTNWMRCKRVSATISLIALFSIEKIKIQYHECAVWNESVAFRSTLCLSPRLQQRFNVKWVAHQTSHRVLRRALCSRKNEDSILGLVLCFFNIMGRNGWRCDVRHGFEQCWKFMCGYTGMSAPVWVLSLETRPT